MNRDSGVGCLHTCICSHVCQQILHTGSYIFGGKQMVHVEPQGRGQMTNFPSHKRKVWVLFSILFQYIDTKSLKCFYCPGRLFYRFSRQMWSAQTEWEGDFSTVERGVDASYQEAASLMTLDCEVLMHCNESGNILSQCTGITLFTDAIFPQRKQVCRLFQPPDHTAEPKVNMEDKEAAADVWRNGSFKLKVEATCRLRKKVQKRRWWQTFGKNKGFKKIAFHPPPALLAPMRSHARAFQGLRSLPLSRVSTAQPSASHPPTHQRRGRFLSLPCN